jgi:hypothetical protein
MSLSFPYLDAIKRDDVEYLKQHQMLMQYPQVIKLAIEHAALRVLHWAASIGGVRFELSEARRTRDWRKIRILLECVIRYGNGSWTSRAIDHLLQGMTMEEVQYLGTRGVIGGGLKLYSERSESLYLEPTMGMFVKGVGEDLQKCDPEELALLHHLSIRPHPLIGYSRESKLGCARLVMYDNFDDPWLMATLAGLNNDEYDGPERSFEEVLIDTERLEPLLLYTMIHERIDRDRVLLMVMKEDKTSLMDLFISKGIRFSSQLKEKIMKLV